MFVDWDDVYFSNTSRPNMLIKAKRKEGCGRKGVQCNTYAKLKMQIIKLNPMPDGSRPGALDLQGAGGNWTWMFVKEGKKKGD